MNEPNLERAKISFVMLSYNHAPFIGAALAGAYGQEEAPFEHILRDDGSTDGTEVVVKEWVNREGIENLQAIFSPLNQGMMMSLNEVIPAIRGRYVVLAASDDISEPIRIKEVAQSIEEAGETVYGGYGDVLTIDKSGKLLESGMEPWTSKHHIRLDAQSIADNFSGFLGASSFYHRDVFDVFGKINGKILHEDMVLNFRAALLGKVIFIEKKLVRYRLHDGNVHAVNTRLGYELEVKHANKIWSSLAHVAAQRCEDLHRVRSATGGTKHAQLLQACVMWRSTWRMKHAIISLRISPWRVLRLIGNPKLRTGEICKALFFRPKARIKASFRLLGIT
jgi:glycosyltransferase involved in cell wall biosynthesis